MRTFLSPRRTPEIRPPGRYFLLGLLFLCAAIFYGWVGWDQCVARQPSELVFWITLVVFHGIGGAVLTLWAANWSLLVMDDGLRVRGLLGPPQPLLAWANLKSIRRGGLGDLVIEQTDGRSVCVSIFEGARDLVEHLRNNGVAIDLSLDLRPVVETRSWHGF